mgnify:CR=1 FL=1
MKNNIRFLKAFKVLIIVFIISTNLSVISYVNDNSNIAIMHDEKASLSVNDKTQG